MLIETGSAPVCGVAVAGPGRAPPLVGVSPCLVDVMVLSCASAVAPIMLTMIRAPISPANARYNRDPLDLLMPVTLGIPCVIRLSSKLRQSTFQRANEALPLYTHYRAKWYHSRTRKPSLFDNSLPLNTKCSYTTIGSSPAILRRTAMQTRIKYWSTLGIKSSRVKNISKTL